jgi:hypothetical protein
LETIASGWYQLGISCLPVALSYLVAWLLLKGSVPPDQDLWLIVDVVACSPVVLYLSWKAVIATAEHHSGLEARWFGSSEASIAFQLMYVAWTIVHIGITCLRHMTPLNRNMMLAHHMLSLASYSGSLITGRSHFWACFAGCCEITNVFLNNVFLAKHFKWNGVPLELSLQRSFACNSLLLWISYVVFRLILFPVWMFLWFRDRNLLITRGLDVMSRYEKVLYPCAIGFLLVYSVVAFVPITKGLMKTLGALVS